MLVSFSSPRPSAGSTPSGRLPAALTAELPTDVARALALAPELAERLSGPGEGRTVELWETLASVAAADLGAARAIEPHLDATAILRQAGEVTPSGTWGVFAAEGGDDPLVASRDADGGGDGDGDPGAHGWRLTGLKPWCSLADRLDHALITARTDEGSRLFAVELRQDGVEVLPDSWHARGLAEVPSGPVRFRDVSARPVGDVGWYGDRPGFAWGGIGVAACWFGGAVGVARRLFTGAVARPSELTSMHLGAIDRELHAARAALLEAAESVDAGRAERILAKRVRAVVAIACERVLAHSAHALGPAPLAQEPEHAKRVADLELYLRQHHAERDLSSLGRALIDGQSAPW